MKPGPSISWRLFCGAAVTAAAAAPAATGKPNIVLVLMDNLGWGELGVYGGGILRGAPSDSVTDLPEHQKYLS